MQARLPIVFSLVVMFSVGTILRPTPAVAKGDDVCAESNDAYQAACFLGTDSDALGFISSRDDTDAYRFEVRDFGATVRVSSIHVNIWFGDFSKLAMARLLIEDLFALDAERDAPEFVFVGDSPNDVSMFAFFPNSVGVANVLKFRTQLDVPPAYVTEAPGGDGFAELGEALLAAR